MTMNGAVKWIEDKVSYIHGVAVRTPESLRQPGDPMHEVLSVSSRILTALEDPGTLMRERLGDAVEQATTPESVAGEILGFVDSLEGGDAVRAELAGRLKGSCPPQLTRVRDGHEGTLTDAAEAIVGFIDRARFGRADGIEHLVLERLQGRAIERAVVRRREQIEGVMRRVADEYLYPALREIGIEDPEGMWGLHGRWER